MKHLKYYCYGAIGLTLVSIGATFLSPLSSNNILFRARATNLSNLSVTFNNSSTVESGSIQSTSCVLSSRLQQSGIKVFATISSDSSALSSEVTRFLGGDASVIFSVDSSSGVGRFRSLQSISFTYRTTGSGNYNILWSADNTSWTTISIDATTLNQPLPSGAHYVKVVNDNAYVYFTSFTLNYSCDGEEEDPVTPGSVVLEGTYNYTSRASHSTPDWSLHNMTITFYSDGTSMWRNVRTNYLSNVFDCKVYFTYVATDTGANYTIAMAHTTYDFTKDGEYNNQASSFSGGSSDRPIDGGFGVATSKNNSGVLSHNKQTLTINVYDQSHSYEVYDTFTFTLAS